jgi:glycine betaine/proline transport system ATP-binding protein
MGLSGSGKSTLLRCINLLHTPTQGKVYIDQEEITGLPTKKLLNLRQKKIGMVFQHFALFPHRTVIKNVEYGMEVQGINKKTRETAALRALEIVGLTDWEYRYPKQLSGGMQQRVGLARALANDPEILLLDEPFSALDPLIRRQMQDEFINIISHMKKTFIFVTHDLHEALKLADRIAVMKSGAITQIGTPEEIVLYPKTDYVEKFVQDLPKMKFVTVQAIMEKPERWIVKPEMTVDEIKKKMENENIWYAYVLDENQRIKCVCDYRVGSKGSGHDLPEICDYIYDFPTTEPEAVLQTLPSVAAGNTIPIAVLDGEKKIIGIVSRDRLLTAISQEDDLKADFMVKKEQSER